MAVKAKKKTAAAAKTAKKKTAKKKTAVAKKKSTHPAKKRTTKPKISRNDRLQCEVCGIAVRIDEACGCVDVCDIICCGEQMTPKKK